jgi:uncharacterized membrane protein YeaQ/YmgE (transglycosylase-associated protein family)
MYLLAWIVIGSVIGWGVSRVFQGHSYGTFMDILMGIGGAVIGGLTISSADLGGFGKIIITTQVAIVGAIVLTVSTAYINGRRILARQL